LNDFIPDNLTKDEFLSERPVYVWHLFQTDLLSFLPGPGCPGYIGRVLHFLLIYSHVDTIARCVIEQEGKNYWIKGQLVKGNGCGEILLEKREEEEWL
jgi:hypothetical protein